MQEYHKNSNHTILTITNAYDKGIKDIEGDIRNIFKKFAKDGRLSPEDAEQLLNERLSNRELDEIRWLVYTIEDEDIKRYLMSRLNAPAYRARISRLEALKERIYTETKRIADIEIQASTRQYIDIINHAYYRTVFDIQKGLGEGFDFAAMSNKTIEEILKNPWSGKHFSERIWGNTDVLAKRVTEIITSGMMSGRTIDQMAGELKEFADVSKFVATRLIRTETTYMANAAEIESYKECDIEEYMYLATLDLRTSEVCIKLDKQVFKVSEAKAGENLPPMHPYCRSTTRAWFGPDTLKNIQRRARDPETGKTYLVPADMTYEQWYQEHVVDKYGQDQAKVMKKKILNKASDRKQYDKYKLIFGDKIPDKLDDFQELKYNNIKGWEDIKAKKQETLNSLEYKDSFFGKFGNKETRLWYKAHDENIPNILDTTKLPVDQAKQAHELRNIYKVQARDMMSDQESRKELDMNYPIQNFEKLLEHKKKKYGLTGDAAYSDIIRSSQTTNKQFDKKAGVEEVGK